MPRALPQNPSLRFLQGEAKGLLKAHKSGDASCCPTLRYHFRFSRAGDDEILKAEVTLQEVQHALALDYGFRNWKDLKTHAEAPRSPVETGAQTERILSEILTAAFRERASDVHIEPMTKDTRVRYRVDGALYEMKPLTHDQSHSVTEHIARTCNLDPAQDDAAQDARMLFDVEGKQLDIRLNIMPGSHGGVVAMRIIDPSTINLSLERLELEPDQLALYRQQIRKASGLILFAGPTGSGKTTSLYATLKELNDTRRKIVTVEDPVELDLEGIDQIPIRHDAGFGFPQALRSVFRQAPNIIMAGEIRDLSTAQLLVQAALTGHLVFSSLHADSCISTLTRLNHIGLAPYLVADTVACVVAQRLVRRVCDQCKEPRKLRSEEVAALQLNISEPPDPIYQGKGCDRCNGRAYRGRTGIYSILPVTRPVAAGIMAGAAAGIESAARDDGWTSLREAAIRKMFRGETTPEEVIKFT